MRLASPDSEGPESDETKLVGGGAGAGAGGDVDPAMSPSSRSTLENIPWEGLKRIRPLDQGHFGIVSLFRYSDADVAVKWERGTGEEKGGLLREIDNLGSIPSHPHLVKILGACRDHPHRGPALVMEYCENGSLKKFVGGAAVNWVFMYKALKMAAEGVDALHAPPERVAHRDLRTANLLVAKTSPDLVVKVADFGLSHIFKGTDTESATETTVGPVPWMAPETLQSVKDGTAQVVTPETDVYMFGGVIFELLSGLNPYSQCSTPHCLDRRLKNPALTPLDDLRSQCGIAAEDTATPTPWNERISESIPVYWRGPISNLATLMELEGLMRKCWSVKPEDRPTMSRVIELLDGVNCVDDQGNTYPELVREGVDTAMFA